MTNIIAFCGPDGSGKSTQAELLKEKLEEEYRVQLVRPVYFLVDVFGLRRFADKAASPRSQATSKKEDGIMQYILPPVAFFYLLVTAFAVKFFRTDIVICDRYLYQTIYDVYGHDGIRLVEIIPSPDQSFLLNPEMETLEGRLDSEDSNVSMDYYKDVRLFYDAVAKRIEMEELPADDDIKQIQRQVESNINLQKI